MSFFLFLRISSDGFLRYSSRGSSCVCVCVCSFFCGGLRGIQIFNAFKATNVTQANPNPASKCLDTEGQISSVSKDNKPFPPNWSLRICILKSTDSRFHGFRMQIQQISQISQISQIQLHQFTNTTDLRLQITVQITALPTANKFKEFKEL